MSRAVWKAVLDLAGPNPDMADLPFGAKAIHVDRDTREPGKIAVWFEVDPECPHVGYHLFICGTGHDLPDGAEHIGSVVMPPFIWHVYLGGMVTT